MTDETKPWIDAFADFETRLRRCYELKARYEACIDGPNYALEVSVRLWRELSICVRTLAEDFPCTLLDYMR